jgi:PAS domain S-box-containing protein
VLNSNFSQLTNLEDELATRIRQQAAVAHLGQRALLGNDLLELMNEAVELIAQTLNVEYCKVLQLLPDGQLLLLAGVGWKEGYAGRATVSADLVSQAGYTLASNEPVIVADLRTETRFSGPALLHEHNVVSGMSVIIQGREQPFGVLGAHTTRFRQFTQDDVNFLQSMANVLAAAIDRKQVEDSLVRLNETLEKRVAEETGYLRLLQRVSAAANRASTAVEAIQFVLDEVCARTGWPVGHAYTPVGSGQLPHALHDPGADSSLAPTTLWHLADADRFQTFRQVTEATGLARGTGLPGRVYASGEPAWVTDVNEDENFPRKEMAADLGVKSGFAFPVMAGPEIVAVLEFFADRVVEPDERLLEVLAQTGTQLGRVFERERAEGALKRRQAQLAEAQRLSHIGSWDWDIRANRVSWSDELYQIYGVSPQEFSATFEAFLELNHPDDREMVRQTIAKAYRDLQPFDFHHRIIRPDGAVRILHAQGKVLAGENGEPTNMLGTGQDITEKVKLEEALRQSLVMWENLFETAPDGTVLVDENGLMVRVNQQMEALFGYTRVDLIGQPLEILLPQPFKEGLEGDSFDWVAYFRDPYARPMGRGLELSGRRKDGSEFPVDIMLSPMQAEGGRLVIAMVRDITDRKRAAEMLRQSEARFRSVFERSGLGIALVDLEGRVLVSNPRLQEMLGYSAEELAGKDLLRLSHPVDFEASLGFFAALAAGEREHYQVEKRFLHKDGQFTWGNFTVSLVRGSDGKPRFAIKMIEEITARKQMEAELAEVQRRLLEGREMERVQLAQELHDEPIQDLYGILYQLNDFADYLANGGEKELAGLRSTVQQIIHKLRAICGELRSPTLAPFGLEGAIREHAEGFQEKYPEIQLSLDLMYDGETLPEQMRLNLFRIYQQAMSNIARHAQASRVAVSFVWNDREVVLQIEDNGRGFQVPRRWIGLVREGHLGLVGAAERAEMIGGKMKIESTPGQGTLIKVIVPRDQEQLQTWSPVQA